MLQFQRFLLSNKVKIMSLLLLATVPLLTGCIFELASFTFGSFFLLDIALIPIRSLLGGAALDAVNTL